MAPSSDCLYLITDRHKTDGRPLPFVVESALKGGVGLLQLREKDLCGRELLGLAAEMRRLTRFYNARLLINDRVDIAIAVGADGVHLGRQSISIQDARRALESSSYPSSVIIGVSTHSLEEVLQAQSAGADFVTFGPVYFTPSKAAYGKPVGIEKLEEVVKAVGIPVYPLGGINRGNLEDILNAGVSGIAAISAVISSADPQYESGEIIRKISERLEGRGLR